MPRTDNGERRQGVYWLCTIPHHSFVPYPIPGTVWIRGQLERGSQGGEEGYLHWQVLFTWTTKKSLRAVKQILGESGHYELAKSKRAREYVWKEDTRVENTQFEFGSEPIQRNEKKDWDKIWEHATQGQFMSIPADVRVRHYGTLQKIHGANCKPVGMERSCNVYWGKTATGKSSRAWREAGVGAYSKTPSTKFWDGYRDEEHVVIDEFRGQIAIHHLLRWTDRYPVIVEIKGGAIPLSAKKFWITSNLSPDQWYPNEDQETVDALKRRLNIINFVSL